MSLDVTGNVKGKLRYNRNGKAKTKQPKKSDVPIVAICAKGHCLGEVLEVIRANEGKVLLRNTLRLMS